ncbi:putative transposase [Cotonvirus japonicus]|uniref:Transposase n=1 Tax=Cotonvirus japonicus TaxID=2811091 RepID=A0ABM7NUG5_9VIRU|nr:putative transposase [Cotonvirus japonicus]BCS83717.1 putative transposase [Cotonvirus japonicus]
MAKKKPPIKSPIFIPNKKLGISEWIPGINKNTIEIETNSWFDIQHFDNPNITNSKKYNKIIPVIPPESLKQQLKTIKLKKKNTEPEFLCCEKIRLYPSVEQVKILHEWFNVFAKMFNVTINYLRSKIYVNGKLNLKIAKKECSFYKVRKELIEEKTFIQLSMAENLIPIHILDEAINQAVSNHKTCIANYSTKLIKKFRVREWSMKKRRKILKIESSFFKDGIFCKKIFPKISSSKSLNGINRTVTLQYDRDTRKYILFVPKIIPKKIVKNTRLSCGIDPGVRTFATVYSRNQTQAICNSKCYNKYIKKHHRKIDKINQLTNSAKNDYNIVNTTIIKNGKLKTIVKIKDNKPSHLNRALKKYHKKIMNKMRDMHYKVAHELVHTYDNIYLGKFNTKSILSKNNTKISSPIKRIIASQSPYLFRQRLTYMAHKYGSNIHLVNEYLTTKTCSNCGQKNELGPSKIHKCSCGMIADRDENAAKNILKIGKQK